MSILIMKKETRMQKYYRLNREKHLENVAEYYQKNKVKIAERMRIWRLKKLGRLE